MRSKLIALKDIAYSNSPIEAINKILKRYLRHYNPHTLEGVIRVVELFIEDYNTRRPHISLKGLTPMEKYIDPMAKLDLSVGKAEALTQRIAENRAISCAFQRIAPSMGEVCAVG